MFKKISFLIFLITVEIYTFGQSVVKLTKVNGIYSIPCSVNGKATLFYFDTGASDVSLSIGFFNQAVKDGIIKTSDLLPEIINYKVADGGVRSGRRINIRELKIGNLKLNNVIGSIIESNEAPLLLGQSALERFGTYTINNTTSTLTIIGNTQSDIDLALQAAKKKAIEQMKNEGQSGMISLVQQQIQQTKVEFLKDKKVASGLEFEVSEIELNKNHDNELTFKYDITNNSGIDYKMKALSQIHIFIDIFTEEGKTYSASTVMNENLAGNTINGQDLRINLRNKIPKYFRIYAVVNGPLLSTIED